MARRRRGRPVNGILVLDKPIDISSNRALQRARGIFNASKAGHTGSLDPLATGVLPVCFGEATKFSQYLLDSDKVYRSTFTLGVVTATGDSEGEILQSQDASGINESQVLEALKSFRGVIEQIPSMFSALKHEGQPLYKLARQGIEVERKVRRVTLYELNLESFRPGEHPQVDIYVSCSKGTYVRSIAEDLGQLLGCGAHVSMLRRIEAGPFIEAQALTLEALQLLRDDERFDALDDLLLPVDTALKHFPSVDVSDEAERYLLQGQAVMVPKLPNADSLRLYNENHDFLGLGEVNDDGLLKPRRLIATN